MRAVFYQRELQSTGSRLRTSKHQDFNQSRLDHNREILLRKPSVTVRLASGTWMYPSFEEPYGCNFCFGWGQLDEAHASIMEKSWGSVWGISTRCLAFQLDSGDFQ